MPLSRSKSIRRDSNSKARPGTNSSIEQPPRTAPLSHESSEPSFLRARSREKRGKSADRSTTTSESDETVTLGKGQSALVSGGRTVVSGGRQVMSKAKSGGGHFLNRLGKLGRSGSSSHEKEVPDAEYVLKVINLPLIEQTRRTRISKQLADCKDKTEYWMPSLPWRCIDYLNLNCEVEGLYRVPGSAPVVKRWQRKFDTQLDVDLLDEDELYDPNTISSMLKSWLRDLPTEVMPKALQHSLAEELAKDNPNYQRLGEPVPQKLRDALSDLPPFNYYLLFAITCHLSLLLSHKERNKMDLNNLSICIGPPLDLDRWLFNYLVGDWRHCWQGCYTEKRYLDAERAHEQGRGYEIPSAFTFHTSHGDPDEDERAVHSSGSGASVTTGGNTSRAGSHYEDARQESSRRDDDSVQNATPTNHRPTHKFPNGSESMASRNGTDALDYENRPSTSGKDAEGSKNNTPTTAAAAAAVAAAATAKHARSRSDMVSSPTKSSFGDFGGMALR